MDRLIGRSCADQPDGTYLYMLPDDVVLTFTRSMVQSRSLDLGRLFFADIHSLTMFHN
jgi:hypothetical protein